jgi:hypothetical protein
MSAGCTSCGRKEGCEHRKSGMFEAIDLALARFYPSRCWDDRRDEAGEGGPDAASRLAAPLANQLARRLSTLCVPLPGRAEEYCAYVYVLCTGRPPALIELREGLVDWPEELAPAGRGALAPPWEELYLRVALSDLGPFAAVQQVSLRGERLGDRLWVEEAARPGVFDPPLLSRFQRLVAVLAELHVRNLDCGDIAEPPSGFDPGGYRHRYGDLPGIINYLFFPLPAASLTSTLVPSPRPTSSSLPPRPPIPDRRTAGIE